METVPMPMQVPPSEAVSDTNISSWPTLSAKFAELINDKNGLSRLRNNLSERTAAAKLNKADADAQKIKGPVTLVLAGMRGISRIISVPLTALEGEVSIDITPNAGYMVKMTHTMVLLLLSALIYVVYTNIVFTHVTDENTFMIVSTLAWMMCLLLIVWLAT
jgi:hypothetical protein